MKRILAFVAMLLCGGCVRMPSGLEPVDAFDLNRYLGTWYEIARLDHSFERGLSHVTAEYSLGSAGAVNVVNRGYSKEKKTWKEARGRAFFTDSPRIGKLKVSFFGPFYGGYNIIGLDREKYSYALVCGPSRSYLWILARTPNLDPQTLHDLVARAASLGFKTENLIYVDHTNGEKLREGQER